MTSPDAHSIDALQDALAGTWSIEKEIGRGGMGVVYLARDVSLDRPVAIKVLHPALARDPRERARFMREARTGAGLSHPHIVPIYAVEQRSDLVFFVMGLIDGESAGDKVRREGPMAPATVEQIVRDIGWGLAYAHAMNVVHRDVTLDNILIERGTGRAVLADFGIASTIDDGEGQLVGTPAYIAPEVIQGAAPGPRSDLYALGISAWTMLAGRHPFIADDTPSLLLQHVTDAVPSLLRAAPRTPSRLVSAIEEALHKDPAARASSIEEWLEAWQKSANTVALADPLSRWVGRWDSVKPFYSLGMSVFAMLSAPTALYLLADVTRFGPYPNESSAKFVASLLGLGIKVVCAILVVHFGIEISELRRLARAGYGVRDLQLALARRREDLRRNPPARPSLLGRVVHDLGWLAGALYVLLATAILKNLWLFVDDRYVAYELMRAVQEIGQWAYVAFWSALGFSFLVPSFRFGAESWFVRLRDRLWASGLGAAVFEIAALGLRRGGDVPQTLHRPTELVLDLAIEDLWNALPPVSRAGVADVPQVVGALRRRVSEVRETERLIDDSQASPSSSVAELRQRLAERHEAGVTALERIRLLLIRLGGAAGPTGEFTVQLEDARAVEQSLLAELGAHASLVKQLKRARRATSITPVMTPAG